GSTLTLNTGTATRDHIQGRRLSTITMSQAQSAATTGRTELPAQPGRGTITFYNNALVPQTIVAATLLTGRDGVQIVTDLSVTVPEGTLATKGQATVIAHTIQTGPIGNIRANDIYGDCCLLKISAVSSAFSGGQEAQTYQSVAKADIDGAVSKLAATLSQAE